LSSYTIRLALAAVAIVLLRGMTINVLAQDEVNPNQRVVRSLLELRQDKVVIQQWDLSCGAAALATILNYQHSDSVSEKTIVEAMLRRTDPLRVKFRGGFSLLDLKRFAESRGYTADGYSEVSIENLVEFGPSIVPISVNGYDHFVVFRALVGNQVLISDPAFGKRILRLEKFRQDWLGNLAFVVSRPDGAISANRLAPQPSDFVRPRDAMLRTATRLGGLQ
jgi:uncharacterized protein